MEEVLEIPIRRERLRRALQLILLLTAPCWARSHKVFPATRDSVAAENRRADALGLKQYASLIEVSAGIERGVLVPFTVPVNHHLPLERRVALSETVAFIEKLNREFTDVTGERLLVDSAIRPTAVQQRLARKNPNAAPALGERASSHERGTTVDLSRRMKRAHYRWLLARLAYYKARGDILVIEERACIHIFVGRESDELSQIQ